MTLGEVSPTDSVSVTHRGAATWHDTICLNVTDPGDVAGDVSSVSLRSTGVIEHFTAVLDGNPLAILTQVLANGAIETTFTWSVLDWTSGLHLLDLSGKNANSTGASYSVDAAWAPAAHVPEPNGLALVSLALLGAGMIHRRKVKTLV
jgi:hypothetical protein